MILQVKTLGESGKILLDDNILGKGGEGEVRNVVKHSLHNIPVAEDLVAKLYFEPDVGERSSKILTMIKENPESDSLAWPVAALYNQNGFVGYVMKKLDYSGYRSWADLSNTRSRRNVSGSFDVKYALVACMNLAISLQSLHNAGHYAGDVNESNIFIGADSSVFIIDTDSAQITDSKGKIFPCLVGKPEYTAAELTFGKFKDQKRTAESDTFAYAVAVYQMLTGGAHPTDGVFTKDDDDPPNVTEKIQKGIYPNFEPGKNKDFSVIKRVPTKAIPFQVRKVLLKALNPEPSQRASLGLFIKCFENVLANLRQCDKIEAHWYDDREKKCGWCDHYDKTGIDPWFKHSETPKSKNSQFTLPKVDFNNSDPEPVKTKRVNIQTSNSNNQNTGSQNVGQQYPQQQNHSQQNGNSYPANNSTPYPNGTSNYSSQNVPESEHKIRKYKGKVVLDYADGTSDIRPPLFELLKAEPKLAWMCFKEETPKPMKLWWNVQEPLVNISGLFAGLLYSVLLSFVWVLLIPDYSDVFYNGIVENSLTDKIVYYFAVASTITVILASLYLFFNGLIDFLKTRKSAGNNFEYVEKKSFMKTLIKYLFIPVLYGPVFVVILFFFLILQIFGFVSKVVKST